MTRPIFRALRSSNIGVGGNEEEEEDSEGNGEESDYEGRDYSWKKTIMIGPNYQVNFDETFNFSHVPFPNFQFLQKQNFSRQVSLQV